jgi:hypothetical protein
MWIFWIVSPSNESKKSTLRQKVYSFKILLINRLEGFKPYPLPTASKKVRSTATFVEKRN